MVTNARQHAAQLGDPAPARHHGRVAIEGVRGGGQTHRGVHAEEEYHHLIDKKALFTKRTPNVDVSKHFHKCDVHSHSFQF